MTINVAKKYKLILTKTCHAHNKYFCVDINICIYGYSDLFKFMSYFLLFFHLFDLFPILAFQASATKSAGLQVAA